MLLARAPLRISLAGGGSDLPIYFEQEQGRTVCLSIDKFVYLAFHHYFPGGVRVAYSLVEEVATREEINHPIFRESMKLLDFSESIEIGSYADVPANGTGLGSSSAFTNALIAGLLAWKGETLSPGQIAAISCKVEIELCSQPIGKQDQWATAVGGLNEFTFNSNGSVDYEKIAITSEFGNALNASLRLFYLGYGRMASNILQKQKRNISTSDEARAAQREIVNLVNPIRNSLETENIYSLGKLLHDSWQLKKNLAKEISTPAIDNAYEFALSCGAIGGKVVGAGGGGFLLLCVPENNIRKFNENFRLLRELPFKLEHEGTKIVYDDRGS